MALPAGELDPSRVAVRACSAHGFTGVRAARLDAYAERFAAAGLRRARVRLPPLRRVGRRAAPAARRRPASSTTGARPSRSRARSTRSTPEQIVALGHVVQRRARDGDRRRGRAARRARSRRTRSSTGSPRCARRAGVNLARLTVGRAARRVGAGCAAGARVPMPIVGRRPARVGAMTSPDAAARLRGDVRARRATWVNEVAGARSALRVGAVPAGRRADRIALPVARAGVRRRRGHAGRARRSPPPRERPRAQVAALPRRPLRHLRGRAASSARSPTRSPSCAASCGRLPCRRRRRERLRGRHRRGARVRAGDRAAAGRPRALRRPVRRRRGGGAGRGRGARRRARSGSAPTCATPTRTARGRAAAAELEPLAVWVNNAGVAPRREGLGARRRRGAPDRRGQRARRDARLARRGRGDGRRAAGRS